MSARETTEPPSEDTRGTRVRVAILMLLTFASGATDAVAFLGLGGVFTANQTGNLVLLGLVGRPDYGATAVRAAVVLVTFALSMYAGFRLTRAASEATARRRAVTWLLSVSLPLQLVVLIGWVAADRDPSDALTLVLLAVSAAALSLQTVAARRMAMAYGVSTTFVTGTIAATLQSVAEGTRDGNRVRAAAVASLVLGALAGAGLLELAPLLAPAVAPLAVAAALWVRLASSPAGDQRRP